MWHQQQQCVSGAYQKVCEGEEKEGVGSESGGGPDDRIEKGDGEDGSQQEGEERVCDREKG
jgi:hypothetical protein